MNHLSDELLNEYLDNALADRAPAADHLAQCAECSARLAALQALFDEIESLPEMTLSRDLHRDEPTGRELGQVTAGGRRRHSCLPREVTRRVAGYSAMPRWLTLTVGLQAALALIAAAVAAPFVIEFASSSLPALQAPSLTETVIQLQSQWIAGLDSLSQIRLPAMPEIPVVEVSSLYFLLALAGASMFWLVGNGLLLRDQIK